ncbi:Glycosyl transferase family 25 [Penicillium taxi]|uniref:Glycosyl transferase family 25 n=1 Tax=Penicillium taxi TaxID=168475 RepID=UPI0025457939|nr:Glycosyl transferase family 25 [Penicillium taxi]KAJ5885010.1 Glycosyl transferase family 25 [Penicillium taxi]
MLLSIFQSRFLRQAILLIGIILITLKLWPASRKAVFVFGGSSEIRESFQKARNETLGVEKVFAINLPGRPDKRDNLVLGSSVTGFRVDWIAGVNSDEINPKTFPYNWNNDHSASEYACRRAHVNGMQRIVEERISSAIIMEDDADWDVSLKAQLESLARAVRALQGTSATKTHSPYGDDWDILWLGHCGVECKTDRPYYLTPADPTVPLPRHFLPYWRESPPIERADDTRLICAAQDVACSSFYAVSFRGAQRILAALSVNPVGIAEEIDIGAQIDVALGRMCGNGYLTCFTAFPAFTGIYRPAGSSAKVSDIHEEEGHVGEKTVHSTWEDVEVPDINPLDVVMGEGEVYCQRGVRGSGINTLGKATPK